MSSLVDTVTIYLVSGSWFDARFEGVDRRDQAQELADTIWKARLAGKVSLALNFPDTTSILIDPQLVTHIRIGP